MNATFRLLANLLRKMPVGVLLFVAEQTAAWIGKRGRAATKCNAGPTSSPVDQPIPRRGSGNDGRS